MPEDQAILPEPEGLQGCSDKPRDIPPSPEQLKTEVPSKDYEDLIKIPNTISNFAEGLDKGGYIGDIPIS